MELLVVIGIVVAIVATLLPALATLRRSARVAHDLSNLRRLQLAQLAYAQDFGGRFADARLPHGGAPAGSEHSFVTTLAPYYDTTFAVRSPLDESPHWPVEMGGAGIPVPPSADRFRVTSYGLNDFLTHQFSPTAAIHNPPRYYDRMSAIAAPASTVHILHLAETGDYAASDHVHVELWGNETQAPVVAAGMASTAAAGGLPKTGDARGNYSFADGHTETLRFSQAYVDEQLNLFNPEVSATFHSQLNVAASIP